MPQIFYRYAIKYLRLRQHYAPMTLPTLPVAATIQGINWPQCATTIRCVAFLKLVPKRFAHTFQFSNILWKVAGTLLVCVPGSNFMHISS